VAMVEVMEMEVTKMEDGGSSGGRCSRGFEVKADADVCPDISFSDVSDVSAIAKTDGEFIAKLPFKWARCANSQSIWVDNPYAKPTKYFAAEHRAHGKRSRNRRQRSECKQIVF